VTASDLIRLGKNKLFEFLQISDDKEFCSFITEEVGADPMDEYAFAEYMSKYYAICDHCSEEFVILPETHCDVCLVKLRGKF